MQYQVNQIFDCEYVTLMANNDSSELEVIRDSFVEQFDLLSSTNQDTNSRLWLSINIQNKKYELNLWNIKPGRFNDAQKNAIIQQRQDVINEFEKLKIKEECI